MEFKTILFLLLWRAILRLTWINKFLTKKLKVLTGEITEKEIERDKRENRVNSHILDFDIKFERDPNHEFKDRRAVGEPEFTLRAPSFRGKETNRSIRLKHALLHPELKSGGRRRTTMMSTTGDFEDFLLNKKISQGRRLRSTLKTELKKPIPGISGPTTPSKPKNTPMLNLKDGLKKKSLKSDRVTESINVVTSPNSEPTSPVTKYLKNEKVRILNELSNKVAS